MSTLQQIQEKYGRTGWSVIAQYAETRVEQQLSAKSPSNPNGNVSVPTGHIVIKIKAPNATNGAAPAIEEFLVDQSAGKDPTYTQVPNGEPKPVSPGTTGQGTEAADKTNHIQLERNADGELAAVNLNDPANPTAVVIPGFKNKDTSHTQIVGDGNGNFNVVDFTNPSVPVVTPVPGMTGKADGQKTSIYTDDSGAWTIDSTDPNKPKVTPIKGPNGQQLGVKAGAQFTDGATGLIWQAGTNGGAATPVLDSAGKQLGGKPASTRQLVTGANGHVMSVSTTDATDSVDTGVMGDSTDLQLLGDVNSPELAIIRKSTGELVNKFTNPAFQEKSPSENAPNTTAPFIHTLQPDPEHPGKMKLVSVPNDNQLTVSQAMMEVLYPQLAAAMTDGKMDAGTAKDLMTQASQQVQDQTSAAREGTTAANDTLTQLNKGAETGASLLNTRVKETQGSLNSWISAAGGNKNLGLGSQLGPSFGANLVNGIGDWATQMGGGQGVYDNATKAVAAINPDDPHSAPSYATLGQMQQRFKELAGVDHSSVNSSTSTPLQTPQPNQVQRPTTPEEQLAAANALQPWNRADQAIGNNAAPGAAGVVAPGSPTYFGFTAPQPKEVQQMQTVGLDQSQIRGFRP